MNSLLARLKACFSPSPRLANKANSFSTGDADAIVRTVIAKNEMQKKPPVGVSTTPSVSHDLFESKLDGLRRERNSRVKMDFSTSANGAYKDPRTQQAFTKFAAAPSHERAQDDFMLSLLVGYATDSPVLGYAAGGSLMGGVVGAGMRHDSEPKPDAGSSDYSWQNRPLRHYSAARLVL